MIEKKECKCVKVYMVGVLGSGSWKYACKKCHKMHYITDKELLSPFRKRRYSKNIIKFMDLHKNKS